LINCGWRGIGWRWLKSVAAERRAERTDPAQRGVVSAESGAGGVAEFMGDILDKFQNLTWEAPVG
jgi:hypothetical protein